jgi:hypothetical protein
MDDKVKSQLEKIRVSGLTNMRDYHQVVLIAYRRKHYDLVVWLKLHKTKCGKYILTGEEPID